MSKKHFSNELSLSHSIVLLALANLSFAAEALAAPAAGHTARTPSATKSAAAASAQNDLATAKRLLSESKYSQAEISLQNVLKSEPDNVEAHSLYGDLLDRTGRLDEAVIQYQHVAELSPSDPLPTLGLSKICLKQQELEMSLSYAQQAVARDPNYLPARIALIETLIVCDQTGEAERQLKYIPQADRNKKAVQKLAYKLALKKGDYSGAQEILMQLNKEPRSDIAINSQSNSPAPGKVNDASDGGDPVSSLEEIDLIESVGNYPQARKKLEEMISQDNETFAARLKLARLLESHFHDYDEAWNNFNEALKLDPLSATAIAGKDRCAVKRRNIALQLKLYLRDFFAKQNEQAKVSATNAAKKK